MESPGLAATWVRCVTVRSATSARKKVKAAKACPSEPHLSAMGRLCTLLILILSVVLRCSAQLARSDVPCATDKDCQTRVDSDSTCRRSTGLCSKNRNEQGCLFRKGMSDKKRVCNSADDADALRHGFCREAEFEYPEVRLFSNNWEEAIFETWVLQIILSELLDVPTTIETAVYGASVEFYDPLNALDFGGADFQTAIRNAARLGDCRQANRSAYGYESCAHVVSEVWEAHRAWEIAEESSAEPPQALGVIGQEGWFVPKFTGERDPTLLSYMGLHGEENRQKLAERFLRPTSWGEYCTQVSNSSCAEPDWVALRAPKDSTESVRYYVEGLYTGYFRKTVENDCDLMSSNCTGHIVNYPCGWSGSLEQTAFYLDIALRSNGQSPGARGYQYEQMMEIWTAADRTKSDVIMMWWFPNTLYQQFLGTESEFTKVNLPPPVQECIANRVSEEEHWCSSDLRMRIGNASGACDEPANPLLSVLSTGLNKMINDPVIPIPMRSPAYDMLKSFQMTGSQLEEIFQYWLDDNDPRESVCRWVADNLNWTKEFIPRSYPRKLETRSNWSCIQFIALLLAFLSTIATIWSIVTVFQRRERRVMVFAQIEFLLLMLTGLLMVSFGALLAAMPLSNCSCTAFIWFMYAGYTLELVPLCSKISARNRFLHVNPALSMKNMAAPRKVLFIPLIVIGTLVMVFLLAWTVFDPPRKEVHYLLKPAPTGTGSVVKKNYFCACHHNYWTIIGLVWNSLLLLFATLLSIRTRQIRQDLQLNESHTLAHMIYSHFAFVVLRLVILFILPDVVERSTLTLWLSIILSIDTLVTLSVYFVPKILTTDEAYRRQSFRALSPFVIWSQLESLMKDKNSDCNDSNERDDSGIEMMDTIANNIETTPDMGLRRRKTCKVCGLDPNLPDPEVEASPTLRGYHEQPVQSVHLPVPSLIVLSGDPATVDAEDDEQAAISVDRGSLT